MPVGLLQLAVTTDAAGAGTASSSVPIRGEILSVRIPNAGTALMGGGGTADFTLTRSYDGGTILSITNISGPPSQYQPRDPAHSLTGGTTAYTLGTGPVYVTEGVPVWGTVTFTLSSGAPSKSGTIFIHYRR